MNVEALAAALREVNPDADGNFDGTDTDYFIRWAERLIAALPPDACGHEARLSSMTAALGSFLWLGNNLHNSDSGLFRELYTAAIGDARTAYNIGAVALGWKPDVP